MCMDLYFYHAFSLDETCFSFMKNIFFYKKSSNLFLFILKMKNKITNKVRSVDY